jgi:adhesin transport system outer membrane protein
VQVRQSVQRRCDRVRIGARWLCPILLLALAACATHPVIAPLRAEVTARLTRLPPSLADSNFGQAIARAVAGSPEVGRSQASVREREADLLAAGGLGLPQLTLGLRPGGGTGFEVAAFSAITQLVFDAGAGRARERAAEARVLGEVAGRIEAQAQAAFAAVAIWAEVAATRELLAAARASLGALEEIGVQIAERTAAGAGSSSDLLTAQGRLANDRAGLVEAETSAARAEAAFTEIFGHPPTARLDLPPGAPAMPDSSLDDTPVILQARAGVSAAEADLAAARAGRMPALSVQVTGTAGDRLTSGPVVEQDVAPSRGVTARMTAAEARLDARHVNLDATQRELQSRLNRLRAEATGAEARLVAARAAVEANRANLTAARELFEVGRSDLIALLDAERETLASECALIMAERDKVVAGYALLAVTGDILAVFGIAAIPPEGTSGR